VALNATYRGHVDGGVGSSSAVSGPIPCVAGTALVITVCADSYFEGTRATVTLSTGWGINHAYWNTGEYSGNGAFTGIFAAIPVPADGSPVITVTTSGGSDAGQRRPSFDIWTLTGLDNANPILQTRSTAGGLFDPVYLNPRSAADSPGQTIAIFAGTDGYKRGAPYVSGEALLGGPGNGFDQPTSPGQRGISGFSTAARWATPDKTYSYTVDPPVSGGAYYVYHLAEFRPAPVVPTVDAGADRSVERTVGVIRTAGETSDGGQPITGRQWRLMSGPGGSGAPVDLPAYQGDPLRVLLPSAVAGVHVVRYTATNSVGGGYDEATITVTPLRPVVEAGADVAQPMALVTRTATETAGDAAITSRRWYVVEGPSLVGSTIGSAAALSWMPPTLGRWVLGYTATSSAGTSDVDTFTATVGVSGIPIRIGRTPEPKIAVAVAFGGNLLDPDGSEWVFTEITNDVRVESGIHLRHGAGDEASSTQPAQLTVILNNRHGRYSLGGLSPHWPNVRQGTPVQVSANLGSGFVTLFTGYADGWAPSWSTVPMREGTRRGDAIVTLTASGTIRRLLQGQPPVVSPIRRGLISATGIVGYWPCEDEREAKQIAPARPEWNPMQFTSRLHGGSNPDLPAARPRLAESDVFVCSNPLPQMNDSEWYVDIPNYTPVTAETIQLRFLIDIPPPGTNNETVLMGLITTGDPSFWEIRYKTTGSAAAAGQITIRAWRNFSTIALDLDVVNIGSINGRRGQLGLQLSKSGSNVRADVDFLEVGASASRGAIHLTTGFTASVGKAIRIQTTTDGGHVDVTMGHIILRSVITSEAENIRHLNAYNGENVGTRLNRLAGESGIWYTQIDPSGPLIPSLTDTMGPQPIGALIELYRDCEGTDRGILWDGVGPGLSYTTKRYREARAAAFTLDAAAGEVGLPFQATHDDAGRVNRAAVTRRGGSNAMFLDETGALGSNTIGRYDTSATVGVRDDSALVQYAAWMVAQGTVEGYRYPQLSLDFVAHPELLDEWLGVIPGDRIDVVGLRSVSVAIPEDTVSLAVEGYEQTITSRTWVARLNTSLYRRWAVARVGPVSGALPEFTARVDTNGTTISVLAAAGALALTVDVGTGPLWTTRAADYPLDLDVGAVRVTATACTAGGVGGNPKRQTFTLSTPMPVTRPVGTRVQLWAPPVFGL
jgi:hypothetical protein